MGEFLIPEGALPPESPPAPPVDPMAAREEKIADDTRVEQSLNGFIAGKQAALFEAPDAFYRAQGEDAIHAAPVATQKLDDLRNDLLDRLGNDYQRRRLGDALDAQMQLTRDGMARHVAEQSLAWQRGVAQDRIALLTREAALHHNDDGLVDALGHAAASAARAHSRVGDGPPGGQAEDAAAATARSGVLGAAIQARLDRGDTTGANTLLTQVQNQLDPEHAAPLQEQIEGASALRHDVQLAQVPPAAKPTKPQRKHTPPPEQLAYPGDKEQQEIISHIHTAEVSQAVERRKAAWDDMLKRLPDEGPGIQVPLPEDWRAELNKKDPTYAKLTEDAAKTYGIPPELLARLFHRESSYNKYASNRGHKGIPQMGNVELRSVGMNPETFLQASAESQINAGAKYLANQYAWFRDWPKAVAAYHSGKKAIDDWSNGTGPGYDSVEERAKPYVDYGGNLRVPTPKEIADDRDTVGRWAELQKELPYVFLGNSNRYGNAKQP